MNKKDDDIAHPGMLSKPEKHQFLAQYTNSPSTGAPAVLAIMAAAATAYLYLTAQRRGFVQNLNGGLDLYT